MSTRHAIGEAETVNYNITCAWCCQLVNGGGSAPVSLVMLCRRCLSRAAEGYDEDDCVPDPENLFEEWLDLGGEGG